MMRQQGDGRVTFKLGGVKMAAKTFDTLAPSLGSHAQASPGLWLPDYERLYEKIRRLTI